MSNKNNNETKYDCLKLENQICFPLYAASNLIVKKYKPLLDKLGLTYTQYITMMVLWEQKEINVKKLGEHLFLDSGTLTPLLKKLEIKGFIKRERSKQDERNLIVSITEEGEKLKERAISIPNEMCKNISLSKEETTNLYNVLHKIIKEG